MAKQETNDSVYKSNYSKDCHITAAQCLAEIMCERYAKSQKRTLPYEFWNIPEWQKHFKQQVFAANALLRQYSMGLIMSAVRECKNAYSLRSKFFGEYIQKHKIRLAGASIEQRRTSVEKIVKDDKVVEQFVSTDKNILKDLD